MSKEQIDKLEAFLKPFEKKTIELVLWLRDFAWDLCPETNELIYDNYNALAIGWSLTEKLSHTVCSIAAYRSNYNVHFGFYRGDLLQDPGRMLLGEGHQYRYLRVKNEHEFPTAYARQLVYEAYTNSLAGIKDPKLKRQGLTIVKSISALKWPERKNTP